MVYLNSQKFSLNSLTQYPISTFQILFRATMELGLSNDPNITARRSSLSSLSSFESHVELPAKESSQIRESEPPSQKSTPTPSSFFGKPRKRPLSWIPAQKDPHNKRPRRSWVYNHGTEVEIEGGDGTRYWLCNHTPYDAKATNAAEYHLKTSHKLGNRDPPSERTISVIEQQQEGAG